MCGPYKCEGMFLEVVLGLSGLALVALEKSGTKQLLDVSGPKLWTLSPKPYTLNPIP